MHSPNRIPASLIQALPLEKQWVWRPESQILRDLGFYNDIPTTNLKKRQLHKVIGSIIDPNDPRRQALRLVIYDLLENRAQRYSVSTYKDPFSNATLTKPTGGAVIDELIGFHLPPTAAPLTVGRFTNTVVDENILALRHPLPQASKRAWPHVPQYFCDPRVVRDGIITPGMIKEKLKLIEAKQASDVLTLAPEHAAFIAEENRKLECLCPQLGISLETTPQPEACFSLNNTHQSTKQARETPVSKVKVTRANTHKNRESTLAPELRAYKDKLLSFFTNEAGAIMEFKDLAEGTGHKLPALSIAMGPYNNTDPRKAKVLSIPLREALKKYLREGLHKDEARVEEFGRIYDEFRAYKPSDPEPERAGQGR